MFFAAVAWLSAVLPMWCVSAPQHPCPSAITTSQPSRVSSRIVASLMSVLSARCAQPVISATRILRSPFAGNTCGSSLRLTGGTCFGAMASIAFSRASGIRKAKGRPILAPRSATRNRVG
jgi:hypothetical protein